MLILNVDPDPNVDGRRTACHEDYVVLKTLRYMGSRVDHKEQTQTGQVHILSLCLSVSHLKNTQTLPPPDFVPEE